MIYISNSIYLATKEITDSIRNKPIIGYHSLFTKDNILGLGWSPAANLTLPNIWYPDTYTSFRSEFGWEDSNSISFNIPGGDLVDYVAIVGHNMNDFGYSYSISYLSGMTLVPLIPEKIPANNNTIIEYFDQITTNQIRITFYSNTPNPDAFLKLTHVKIGRALFLQRRRFVGVKPYGMDVQYEGLENVSDNGNYLGSYVTSESQNWEIKQDNNDPTYVREKIIPFLDHLHGVRSTHVGPPFTFVAGWRPDDYPDEILYCWKPVRLKVAPEIQRRNGMMSWEASGKGIR